MLYKSNIFSQILQWLNVTKKLAAEIKSVWKMSKILCQTGPDSRKQGHARGFSEKGQKRPK